MTVSRLTPALSPWQLALLERVLRERSLRALPRRQRGSYDTAPLVPMAWKTPADLEERKLLHGRILELLGVSRG